MGNDIPWLIYSSNLFDGLSGTLWSPNRGLFIFCPWTVLALAVVPIAVGRRLEGSSIVRWLLWALVPFLFMLSKYGVWYGGHSFGPRYWTEVIPLLGVLLAYALAWSWARRRAVFVAFAVTIVFSFGIQVIGAFYYPSSWNSQPTEIDQDQGRLWDWRDTELRRCLSEGPYLKRGLNE